MVKRDFISTIIAIFTILAALFLLHSFFLTTYTIQEKDQNNYVTKGDVLVLQQKKEPDYDDFVLYEVDNNLYLGRVMGKSQDHLASVEDILYRNQAIVEQPYLESLKQDFLAATNHEFPFTDDFNLDTILQKSGATLPEEHYFVLNDNRQNTSDSRQFGPISQTAIRGVVSFRLAPLDKFGFVTTK